MPKDVLVMRAPEAEPQWKWARWLRATETSLEPTALLLFVRDNFDALEALLRDALAAEAHDYSGLPVPLSNQMSAMLVKIDAARKEPGNG